MRLSYLVVGVLMAGTAHGAACQLEFDNGAVLRDVPLANSPMAMVKGLSGRKSAGQGMLFSFGAESLRVVWMKDTSMPLSAAFLALDGTVLSIVDLEPMSEEYRWSADPASDILELARGQFEEEGIEVGSKMLHRSCR